MERLTLAESEVFIGLAGDDSQPSLLGIQPASEESTTVHVC